MKKLRIVFMGTPDFARQILAALHFSSSHSIVGVYCQPDRPAGRGKKLQAPAVKIFAQEHNYAVYQPLNFKQAEDIATLRALEPDVLVVAAYGLILPQEVLDIPHIAPINVHGSLLPKYRGAAPVQRAIMDGQEQSGVCIMKMEAGLDTGPYYSSVAYDLTSPAVSNMTSEDLLFALADLGSAELIKVLDGLSIHGALPLTEQDHASSTYAKKLCKEESFINFAQSANIVHAHIRGLLPWPGAKVSLLRPEKENLECSLGLGAIGSEISNMGQFDGAVPNAGEIWRLQDGSIALATNDKWYMLGTVCPKGKKAMQAKDFANGYLAKGLGLLASVQLSM